MQQVNPNNITNINDSNHDDDDNEKQKDIDIDAQSINHDLNLVFDGNRDDDELIKDIGKFVFGQDGKQ